LIFALKYLRWTETEAFGLLPAIHWWWNCKCTSERIWQN